MDAVDYLNEALKTLSSFASMTLPQQIMFLVVLGAITLILITRAVLAIAEFFKKEDIRREEAYRETLRIRAEQQAIVARLQREATQAFLDNIEAAYKQDFEYYRGKIAAGKYPDIWGKIPKELQEEVAGFVYKDDLKPEEKSARIILLIRSKK